MSWNKNIRFKLKTHIYLIKGSFPRILDLIYWPTIQNFSLGVYLKIFYFKFNIF